MSPILSIIVPIFNVEQYIDRCFHTLVNQELKDIEIILVDDGSQDKSPVLCDEYAKLDNRVRVIHKQNAGLGFARNSGIEIAKGKYVAFVDSDDYVDLSMYNKLVLEAEKSNADVVFCGYKTETRMDVWIDSNEVEQLTVWEGSHVVEFMLDMIASAPGVKHERKYAMSVWHGVYSRNVIKENNIQFPSERQLGSEDLPFHVDFLKLARKVVYMTGNYYFYCLNATSLTATFNTNKFERYKCLYTALLEKLKSVDLAQCRIDRFIIGYTRTYILQLISSNLKNKRQYLCDVCQDKIWNDIQKRYSPKQLPLYPRIIYWLMIHKHIVLLMLLCIFISLVKVIVTQRK